jgi:hypothetical protein
MQITSNINISVDPEEAYALCNVLTQDSLDKIGKNICIEQRLILIEIGKSIANALPITHEHAITKN